MEKGLEISFRVGGGAHEIEVTEALANIIGNRFKAQIDMDWRIFHVTLGNEKFFKVLYTGRKVGRLHPHIEKKIREDFDTLSKNSYESLLHLYKKEKRTPGFEVKQIKQLKEEYDLWEDRFWEYF
ncbi:MAG: DUF2004 domain-containing protein [Candidatus Thermoplasmatota archaeon]|jgi:hypothetical protein|nr:DUF2004 domain-containing protein [Candidatus Thermoplasmatota archaeon]MCL5785048.1 DUF2004 domain-containing protein [Candidatus Thermoplasmatota archaeon]